MPKNLGYAGEEKLSSAQVLLNGQPGKQDVQVVERHSGVKELVVDAKIAEVLAESLNLRYFAAEEHFVVVPCAKFSSQSLSAFSHFCHFNLCFID